MLMQGVTCRRFWSDNYIRYKREYRQNTGGNAAQKPRLQKENLKLRQEYKSPGPQRVN